MKILFLCRRPFDSLVGGVAEYLHYLPIALQSLNIESLSYTEGKLQTEAPRLLANHMPAYSGPYLKPSLFSFSNKLKPLFELCQREKISLVHAQGVYRSGYVAEKIFEQTGIPFIVTSHSDILSTNSERIQRGKVRKRCQHILKNAAAVTHLTPLMAKACHEIYDTQEKSFIIGNGITLSEWKNFRELPEKNYMLAIGRLETGKGFNILIDAFSQLQKTGSKTSLIIAGDGSARQALQNQATQLGLNMTTDLTDSIPESSVIFPGYIKADAKKKLFSQSQFILFPTQPHSWEEAFSIVQLETMAAGKAMIASDTAPTRYLQTLGLQTLLVKADDSNAWANAMKNLLEHDADRKNFASKNLENSQQFDWHKIALQYQIVYQQVCKEHQS